MTKNTKGGMKKKVLIGVIVVVLVVGGVVAWYFLKGNDNAVVVPNQSSSESGILNPQDSSGALDANISFGDAYKRMTKAQKNCLLNAIGQTKLDGFLNNDMAIMQTITGEEYEKASACPQ